MNKSKYIHKDHKVSVFLYHLVFPAKYRRAVLTDKVDAVIKDICLEIEKCYEIKRLTARQAFAFCPEVKELLFVALN